MNPSTVILIGAGASCSGSGFSGNVADPERVQSGNPPLGKNLLTELMKLYQDTWAVHAAPFFSDPTDFEVGMEAMFEALWMKGDQQSRLKFNWCIFHMAEYFSNWKPESLDNPYLRFVAQLEEAGHLSGTGVNPDLSFISLNYERLLERALMTGHDRIVTHCNRKHDRPEQFPNSVTVWKPHGSCHFIAIRKIDQPGPVPVYASLRGWAKSATIPMISETFNEIAEVLDSGADISVPVGMCLYMRGKPAMAAEKAIKLIRHRSLQDISSASRIVMIGARPVVHDDHIFGAIRSCPDIIHIGYDDPDVRQFAQGVQGRFRRIADTFTESLESGSLLEAMADPAH